MLKKKKIQREILEFAHLAECPFLSQNLLHPNLHQLQSYS